MTNNFHPKDGIDKLFRVQKFQYNRYEIDSPDVKGILRIADMPANIIEVPSHLVAPEQRNPDIPTYVLVSQSIVSFSNKNNKKDPSPNIPDTNTLKNAERKEITNYILDPYFEPWNEYIIQGDPPILIKARTIITRLDWYVEYTNMLGDPFLWANYNTSLNASKVSVGDAGSV